MVTAFPRTLLFMVLDMDATFHLKRKGTVVGTCSLHCWTIFLGAKHPYKWILPQVALSCAKRQGKSPKVIGRNGKISFFVAHPLKIFILKYPSAYLFITAKISAAAITTATPTTITTVMATAKAAAKAAATTNDTDTILFPFLLRLSVPSIPFCKFRPLLFPA